LCIDEKKKSKIEWRRALSFSTNNQLPTRRMTHSYNTRYQQSQRPALSNVKPVSKLLPQSERAVELSRRWSAALKALDIFRKTDGFRCPQGKGWIRLSIDKDMSMKEMGSALYRAFIDANPQFILEDMIAPWKVMGRKAYIAARRESNPNY